jgi:D-alanyl-D-alanine dipeptidase
MPLQDILLRPVPDYTSERSRKIGYRDQVLSLDVVSDAESLVDIATYGIAGQSYYSRPNRIGKPTEGVLPTVYLRQHIAERLAAINYELQISKEVTKLCGGPVELYIEEGLRSQALQSYLYKEAFPAKIRAQHPEMDEKAVLAQRDELISRPSGKSKSPSPHATGAAFDLSLRYAQPNLGFVAQAGLSFSEKRFHTQHESYPDYFEHERPLNAADKQMQRNRRIVYWVMRGALVHGDSGFWVNPTEWWHWSYGDQMWAVLTHAPMVLYGRAPEIDVASRL